MLLCGPLRLRLRAPVAPLRVQPPVLVQVPLASGALVQAHALAVPAALPSPLS
jgi:hypothetical protein